jgi:hypothetical protein
MKLNEVMKFIGWTCRTRLKKNPYLDWQGIDTPMCSLYVPSLGSSSVVLSIVNTLTFLFCSIIST